LAFDEGLTLTLVNSNYVALKSAPGPINRAYPHIRIEDGRHNLVAEMWTDIEFLSLSYSRQPTGPPSKGDYHELDIAVLQPALTGRPPHDAVWLGVECKNTGYNKGLLKEILGVRRELSYLSDAQLPTRFRNWPRATAPCRPASCLLVYASDPQVQEYARPGEVFGINFHYEPLGL
jgi:hypothetical protein